MKKFFYSIFFKLIVVTIVPLLILNFFYYKISKNNLKNNIKKILYEKLENEDSIIVNNLLIVKKDFENFSKYLYLNISNYREFLKFIFYSNKSFVQLSLLDNNFKPVYGISKYIASVFIKKPFIKKGSKYWILKKHNEYVLCFIKKINNLYFKIENISYVYSEISLKNIFNQLNIKTSDKFQYFVLDNNGDLIFHPDYNFVLLKRDYSPIVDKLKGNNPFFIETELNNPLYNINESYLVCAKRTFINIPLILGVEIKKSIAYGEITQIINNIIGEIVVIFILMAIVSFIIAKNITEPIENIKRLSDNIASGNFHYKVKNLPDNEIGYLGKNIEKMAETIEENFKIIENERDKLNRLFNSINDGIYVVDKDYNITMINNAELNYLNKKREEVIGKKCFKIFAKINKPCAKCLIGKKDLICLNNISPSEIGFRQSCKRDFVNMTFIKFGENEFLIYLHDITEIVKSFKAVETEREKLKVTLQSIGDGVVVVDKNLKIILMNNVAEKLTGWNEKSSIGKNIETVFNIVDERNGEKIESPIYVALKNREIVSLSNHALLLSKNGEKFNVEDSAAPILLDNELIGGVLIFRDVTAKKKMEMEIQKIEKLEVVGRLAAGIAHDFNNVLTGIYGNLSLIKLFKDDKEKLEKLLIKIENSFERAKSLTSQLLTFSKGGTPVKEVSSIEEIIKQCVEFALAGSNIKIKYNFSKDLYKVNVDANLISQVFENLAINAKDAMPQGGTLEIYGENMKIEKKELPLEPGLYVKIIFKDYGTGIKKDILSNIFEPFFTTKEKGSGLGLSICYSIIKNHDGFIEVKSEEGKGTEFTVYLPAVTAKTEEKKVLEKKELTIEIKKLKILIMDDNKDILDAARELFGILGATVEVAKNGEEAIEKYKKEKFDIVILDLTVKGGMGGKEAIRELIKIDNEIIAVVSSGYYDDPVLANFKDYGFKYALLKPYTLKEVKKMISELMENRI